MKIKTSEAIKIAHEGKSLKLNNINNLFYTFLMVCLISSCSKEKMETASCLDESPLVEVCLDEICIDGEWDWVKSYGSIAGLTITPQTEMQTRRLVICETTYQEFVNDELILDTTYEYVKNGELRGFTTDSLVLRLATGSRYAVFKENEQLVLFEPCFDCWEHTYERPQ